MSLNVREKIMLQNVHNNRDNLYTGLFKFKHNFFSSMKTQAFLLTIILKYSFILIFFHTNM